MDRRRHGIDAGIVDLCRAVEAGASNADAMLRAALDSGRGHPRHDDVAVLVAHRPDELAAARFTARVDRLAAARHLVRDALLQAGVAVARVDELTVAVGEAMENAVEHAYAGRLFGHVDVAVRADDAELSIEIKDHGTWRGGHGAANRGMGTPLMRALADEVEITRTPAGTSVTLRVRRDAPAAG